MAVGVGGVGGWMDVLGEYKNANLEEAIPPPDLPVLAAVVWVPL